MAVDILPASIPLDASEHFSNALLPYLSSLIDSTLSGKLSSDQYLEALDRATIASGGELTPKHQWLSELVASSPKTMSPPHPVANRNSEMKNVLLLGSGMVAGPVIDRIAQRNDVRLLVGKSCGRVLHFVSHLYPHSEQFRCRAPSVSRQIRQCPIPSHRCRVD
jgi:alpha-aminoadipic semialdehyde synthase